mmetsp:Transcript_57600/g.108564  ORF Transcript_57600/g.108564 Transcript_57600/m.108564 type:complete len:154 (+) Transcript_57600:842-1303(+)
MAAEFATHSGLPHAGSTPEEKNSPRPKAGSHSQGLHHSPSEVFDMRPERPARPGGRHCSGDRHSTRSIRSASEEQELVRFTTQSWVCAASQSILRQTMAHCYCVTSCQGVVERPAEEPGCCIKDLSRAANRTLQPTLADEAANKKFGPTGQEH